jgi:PIN domain nuclease of toxin-antitoxin system
MPRYLLDTHALLWWLDGDRRLVRKPRQLIQADDNEILVSAALSIDEVFDTFAVTRMWR